MNSLLHHLSDEDLKRLLGRMHGVLTDGGHVHIIDLVLPEQRSVARVLAHSDRGDYPRSLGTWKDMFAEFFCPVTFEPFSVKLFGITLWNLVYFKGRRKT